MIPEDCKVGTRVRLMASTPHPKYRDAIGKVVSIEGFEDAKVAIESDSPVWTPLSVFLINMTHLEPLPTPLPNADEVEAMIDELDQILKGDA